MGLSEILLVGLVPEREREFIGREILHFGVNSCSATAADVDVSLCSEVGSETARMIA